MNKRTALIGGALVVVAVVLLIVLSGGEDGGNDTTTSGDTAGSASTKPAGGKEDKANETPKKPQVPTIVIREGEPVGGVQTLEYSAGEEIRFRVSSDAAEEIHVHGYDIAKEVPAGGTVGFDFPAELEGIYEAELEELGVQIAELRVNP